MTLIATSNSFCIRQLHSSSLLQLLCFYSNKLLCVLSVAVVLVSLQLLILILLQAHGAGDERGETNLKFSLFVSISRPASHRG
jgi:hypothetical protein